MTKKKKKKRACTFTADTTVFGLTTWYMPPTFGTFSHFSFSLHLVRPNNAEPVHVGAACVFPKGFGPQQDYGGIDVHVENSMCLKKSPVCGEIHLTLPSLFLSLCVLIRGGIVLFPTPPFCLLSIKTGSHSVGRPQASALLSRDCTRRSSMWAGRVGP